MSLSKGLSMALGFFILVLNRFLKELEKVSMRGSKNNQSIGLFIHKLQVIHNCLPSADGTHRFNFHKQRLCFNCHTSIKSNCHSDRISNNKPFFRCMMSLNINTKHSELRAKISERSSLR